MHQRRFILGFLLGLAAMAAPRPPLVVVVSVDQFSAELMERWGKDLPGGLGRLRREGTAFLSAYHDHGYTETGPGHSVILTGRHPAHTGITENMWYDRASAAWVYCVADPASPVVGARGASQAFSARNLKGDTLGGWLQDQIPGSRTFAMSGKDRSAILMAGPRAQGVYWYEGPLGFSTSTAYARSLPPWLVEHNRRFLGSLDHESLFWEPLDPRGLPPAETIQVRGVPVALGLPRLVQGLGMPRDAAFWWRFTATPFFDKAILGAAEALVEGEELGRGPGVDLLVLGLSATDYVGHSFGTTGPEMLDTLRRLDQELGRFLDRLLKRVPGTWVILTADHGSSDIPEKLQARGIPARRLDLATWQTAFNGELSRRLGVPDRLFLPSQSHMLYLDPRSPQRSGLDRARVLGAAVEVAKAMPEVAEACLNEDLARFAPDPLEAPEARSLKARLRLSLVPERSGDLLLAFQPLVMADEGKHPACHGHPYDYDRRVPLVFWGPFRAEARSESVRTVDLAPTLARELGIHPGEPVDGRPLDLSRKAPARPAHLKPRHP